MVLGNKAYSTMNVMPPEISLFTMRHIARTLADPRDEQVSAQHSKHSFHILAGSFLFLKMSGHPWASPPDCLFLACQFHSCRPLKRQLPAP